MNHEEVHIDTTHIVVELEGYTKTENVTIPRGAHTARSIVQMIACNGFNTIDGYWIFDRVPNGSLIYLGPRSYDHPPTIVISHEQRMVLKYLIQTKIQSKHGICIDH